MRTCYAPTVRTLWTRIKSNWNRDDTVVFGGNLAALGAFIGNAWWESAAVTYLACLIPLALQTVMSMRLPSALRSALISGLVLGLCWPLGEAVVTMTCGWWGDYVAPGVTILYTPVYCMLIGWLATAYLFYLAQRVREIGYGRWTAVLVCGGSAAVIGAIGENLFVASGMWTYEPSNLDLFNIPLFLPIAYGLGYGVIPFLWPKRPALSSIACSAAIVVASVGLGFAVGFFPR